MKCEYDGRKMRYCSKDGQHWFECRECGNQKGARPLDDPEMFKWLAIMRNTKVTNGISKEKEK